MKNLNLDGYGIDELLLAALRSEIDAERVYSRLGKRVKNAFLRDRLKFLAGEERRHRDGLRRMYAQLYPRRELKVPARSPVPLPEIEVRDERVPLSEVLHSAMKAERAAYLFYQELALKFRNHPGRRNLLLHFASMEQGHYRLLESEKQVVERMEEWGEEQEMVHVGP